MSALKHLCRAGPMSKWVRHYSNEHPFNKSLRILTNQVPLKRFQKLSYPEHADVVVIGGGVMGSSVAYWLKTRAERGISVVVLEKDPTYKQASTVLSAGGLRQQFSLPENVQLSQYCAEFLRDIKRHLGADVDVQYVPHGYLVLADERHAAELEANVTMQKELGVKNELLSPEKLKLRYPWLNVEDVKLACIGSESEGWFDPWALLNGFRSKALSLGAEFIKGDVCGFVMEKQQDVLMQGVKAGSYERINKVIFEGDDGEKHEIKFAACVLAAGANSGEVASKANIGTGEGLLHIPLPVEPRKRCIYCFGSQGENAPGIQAPMIMDTSGTWVRREGLGNSYICGRSPDGASDSYSSDLDVDYPFFDEKIWPYLAHRIPAFENLKVKSAWAGWYEYNTFDENGIIGPHPYHSNLYIAAGFSGHGLQHAPATGRAIAELIIDSQFVSIDLTRLGFDRLLTDRPMIESNIY